MFLVVSQLLGLCFLVQTLKWPVPTNTIKIFINPRPALGAAFMQ